MAEDEDRIRPDRIIFVVLPAVHILDLAGALQAFFEANQLGARFALRFCAPAPHVQTAQGLRLAGLAPLPKTRATDLVLVPGTESTQLEGLLADVPVDWLNEAYQVGARIGSICSAAFVLAAAGLLDNRACTTHWKLTDRLAAEYPRADVQRNRLFVSSGRIVTSAGVTSGIDMALALIEQAHGPLVAARTAREMVVYARRNGESGQESIYLRYRAHMHSGVHRVQDWLMAHPDENPSLESLSAIAQMSPRHLTRTFREATGTTLKTFATQLKLEVAQQLLSDPTETVESVALQCGYEDARQLRRLFQRYCGKSPARWQQQQKGAPS